MYGVEWSHVSLTEKAAAFTPCPPHQEAMTVGGRSGKPKDSLYGAILEKLLRFQLQHQGGPGRNGSHLLILHFDQLLCLSVWCWERQNRNRAFYPVVLSQLAREVERRKKHSQSWFRLAG